MSVSAAGARSACESKVRILRRSESHGKRRKGESATENP
jgi:hypothetical protein